MIGTDLRQQIVILTAMALLLGSTVAVNVRIASDIGEELETDVMFLPSGKYLQAISFGFDNLLADVIYLWSLQHYTNFDRKTRFPYLFHTFDVITDLDPQYIDAYMIGALIIIAEGKDMLQGIRLLNKGIAVNPDDYLLPLDAGFYFRDTFNDPLRATRYFSVAAGRPEAPNYIKRLCAGMIERRGDKRESYHLWKMAFDEAEKEEDRTICQLHLRILHDEINLESIEKAIEVHRQRFGRNPSSLERLVQMGLLADIPLDFRGDEYQYDPLTGTVSGSTLSVIKER